MIYPALLVLLRGLDIMQATAPDPARLDRRNVFEAVDARVPALLTGME